MLCSQILWLGWVDPTKPPDIVNGFGSSSGQRRVSFRDKVLGIQSLSHMRERVNLIDNNLVCIEHDNENRLLPNVYIDDSCIIGHQSSYLPQQKSIEQCYGCYGHLGRDCKVLSSQGVLAEGMVADEPKAMVARGYMNNGNGSTIQAVSQGIKSEIHSDWLKVTKGDNEDIFVASQQHRLQEEKKDVGLTISSVGLKFMTQHKKRVRRDESTVAKPIVKPVIVTNKRQSRIQKEKQKNTNGLGKTGSYAGVTTTTTKENNSTHDPGIAYPFGVECLDHATSKEGTINVVNSINRVLEIREDVVVPRLLSKRVVELAKTITKEEVGIALRSMGSYKAPSTMSSLVDYVHISDSNSKVNDF
ncbi:hypothetical protein POTOM_035404 [Populus tomentosa]|uniref:Uncharacterized protein n=1 Tax=Populus tomentosa TaxID=118781 RepID=A0A8X7YYH6_POPTO|nr:hypothetical protein POTOM_035404 [Populus tomentosa]